MRTLISELPKPEEKAAERRKNAAHGVSRGLPETEGSPSGAKESLCWYHHCGLTMVGWELLFAHVDAFKH